ncbi:BlaI/MecI/CopY family transcriptional regulator [Reichenbachiella sp. MALMAid0571]|uniref:BlaI/MecI/CopY family transcriptional regulator n=1 Tax=Reichenbachiella sp. MALMAid0571 TaxID=3143939 RepID=UPI0032DE67F2
MEKLAKAEEPIMHWLWKCKKAFVKEIIEKLPDSKPLYNTVSLIMRVLVDKGMVGNESFRRTHRYFAILSKNEYRT